MEELSRANEPRLGTRRSEPDDEERVKPNRKPKRGVAIVEGGAVERQD